MGFLAAPFAWLRSTLAKGGSTPSTKRLLVFLAGLTCCGCTAALTKAISTRIYRNQPVDGNAVMALGLALGTTGTLAGVAYRKPEHVGAVAPTGLVDAVGDGVSPLVPATDQANPSEVQL